VLLYDYGQDYLSRNFPWKENMEKTFKNIFWDADIEKIDPKTNSKYVIDRILEYGDKEQVKWMLHFYSRDQIIKEIETSRQLSNKSANFWANYFNLPYKGIKCLNKPFQETQKAHWPY
jgi:hypothetical protein